MLRAHSSKIIAIVTILLISINTQPEAPCTLKKMLGNHPDEICKTIKWLERMAKDPLAKVIQAEQYQNRMLLYGPPGNGKSTYAQQIAQETGREFLSVDASSIVIPYTGGGVQRISELIKNAKKIAQETGNGVVIFIDEIDALAANAELDHRTEHKLTLQKIWIELDLHENDANLFFIFATNNLDKIHPTFKNRFDGAKIIEINNPDTNKRLILLNSIFRKKDIPILNKQLITAEFVKILDAHYEDINNQIDLLENFLKLYINNSDQKKVVFKLALCIFQLNHIKIFLKTYNNSRDMDQVYTLFETTLTNISKVLIEAKPLFEQSINDAHKKSFEAFKNKIDTFPLKFIKCNIDLHKALLAYNEKNALHKLDPKISNEVEAKKLNELIQNKIQLEAQLDSNLKPKTKASRNDYQKILDLYFDQMNIGFKASVINLDQPRINLILEKTEGLCTRSYIRVINNLRNLLLKLNNESDLKSTFEKLDQMIVAEKIVDPKKDEDFKKASKEKEEETMRLLQIEDLVRRVSSNPTVIYSQGLHGGSAIPSENQDLHRYSYQVNYPAIHAITPSNPLIKKAIELLKKK